MVAEAHQSHPVHACCWLSETTASSLHRDTHVTPIADRSSVMEYVRDLSTDILGKMQVGSAARRKDVFTRPAKASPRRQTDRVGASNVSGGKLSSTQPPLETRLCCPSSDKSGLSFVATCALDMQTYCDSPRSCTLENVSRHATLKRVWLSRLGFAATGCRAHNAPQASTERERKNMIKSTRIHGHLW